MTQSPLILAAWIGAVAMALNIPLGYARQGAPRYSAKWFLYIHLSIPVIAYLRITNRLTAWSIPAFIACAVVGQLVGGRVRRRRDSRA